VRVALLIATLLATLPAPVTLQGVGGVTPGMTPAQVAAAWGVRVKLNTYVPGSTCSTAAIKKGRLEGYAIFEKKRFGAVFFFKGPVTTDTGIRLGSTMAQIKKAYGARAKGLPDKYVPKAKNVFVGGKWKLRFDVNPRGRVTVIAFGGVPVTYVEACS
jgi:hypothetical protein